MSCFTAPEKFFNLVKTLLQVDQKKYLQFDNVVKFVLQGKEKGLSPENRVLAISHLAHIYQELAFRDTRYDKGQVEAVLSLEGLRHNLAEYLENIEELYPGFRAGEVLTLQHVQPALDEIRHAVDSAKPLANSQVKYVLSKLDEYLRPFKDLEAREQAAQPVYEQLTELLRLLGNPELSVKTLEAHKQVLAAHRQFIPLTDALEKGSLASWLGVTLSGQRIELTRNPLEGEEGQSKYLHNGEQVDESLLVGEPVRSNPVGKGLENTGQNVFMLHELGSALIARALNPAEQEDLDKELAAEGINLDVRLRIEAVPLEAFTDQRIEQLHELAANNPDFAGLARREHETFENEAQIRRLQKGDEQILTVRRPTLSEDGFSLLATLPSGRKFVLYSPKQFTVVNSDNTTRPLDLTNQADLELAGSLSVVRQKYGKRNLDMALDANDLLQLKQSIELYNRFENNVLEILNGNNPVDVTELFHNHYRFAGEKPVQTLVPLSEFMQRKGEEVTKTVTTVRLEEGVPVLGSEQTKSLPVVFTRYRNQEFKPINALDPQEFIWHTDEAGKSFPYTYEKYISDVLGIDHDKLIKDFLSDAQYKNVWSLMVYFSNYGGNKFMLVEQGRVLSQVADMAEFLTSWELQRSVPERNRNAGPGSWLEFGQQGYRFKDRQGVILNFNAERKPGPNQGKFMLELRSKGVGNTSYSKAVQVLNARLQDWKINFYLDPEKVSALYKNLLNISLIADIKKAFPGLDTKKYELSTLTKSPQVLNKFYQEVATLMGKDRTSDLSVRLQEATQRMEESFGQLLKTDVTDHVVATILKTAEERADTETLHLVQEAVKEIFTNPLTKEDTSFLLGTEFNSEDKDLSGEERRYVPTIQYAQNRPIVRRFDQYQAVTALPRNKGIQIRPATSAGLTQVVKSEPAVREVVPVQTPVVETPVAKAPTQVAAAKNKFSTLPTQEDFSIGISNPVTVEDVAEQIANVRKWLPQFKVSEQDVTEFFDVAQYDGHINGAYVNRLIYLNKVMSESGTVYHEAFHGVFRDLLRPEQREAMIALVRQDNRYKARFTESALKEFARQRKQEFNQQTANRVAEEILADQFRDHVLNKKPVSKSLLRRFFELLQKLFRVGQAYRQSQLDEVYDQIQSGYFATKELNSTAVYPGEVALELIPGIAQAVKDPESNTIKQSIVQMSVGEQQQLVAKLVHDIMQYEDPKVSFNDKFDAVRVNLYKTRFDLDAQTEGFTASEKAKYIAAYETLYKNYQFVLGKAYDGEEMTIVNKSDDTDLNDVPVPSDGELAVESLRKQAENLYNSFVLKEYFEEVAEQDRTKLTASQVVDGAEKESQDDQDAKEESPASDFDSAPNEHNRLDGLSTLMRRFFSLVEYQDLDTSTGFWVPRMVDGQQIFNTLMKATSDAQPHEIIQQVRELYEQYEEDGYHSDARAIKAVYDTFAKQVGLDPETDLPTQHHQIYSQFIDAFHGTEMEYLVNTVRLKENPRSDAEEAVTYKVSSEIKDALIKNDLLQKKLQLNDGVERRYNEYLSLLESGRQDPVFEAALKTVQRISTLIYKSHQTNPLLSGDPVKTLTELVDGTAEKMGLHQALRTIGFDVPKSLLTLSLQAIDRVENLSTIRLASDSKQARHFEKHKELVQEGKYLQKTLFNTLHRVAPMMASQNSVEDVMRFIGSENSLKDKSATGKLANAYNAVLTRASYYIVRYDPSGLQSTTRNGEGKPIYRYTKYTPTATMAQDIRKNGLASHFAKDPYYAKYLASFYQDNKLVNAAMNGGLSREAHEAQLFFDNLRIAAWGAIKQTVGGEARQGVSYNKASLSDLQVNYLNFFQNRKEVSRQVTVVEADGSRKVDTISIVTYNRTLTQLEASGSNYMVTAKYRAHVGLTGKRISYQGSHNLIVETLEGVMKQEFNRMRREWKDKEQRATDIKAGKTDGRGINVYNAKGTISNPVTDDKAGLRAYQFNTLPGFVKANPTITTQLQTAALDGNQSFEEIMKSEVGKRLRTALHTYSEKEYQKHLDLLEANGVIERSEKLDILFDSDLDSDIKQASPVSAEAGDDPTLVAEYEGQMVKLKSAKKKKTYKAPLLSNEVAYDGQAPRSLTDLYGADDEGSNFEALIRDAYFNFWENSLLVNQVFDGDIALSVKNAVDYFKRNKSWLASGSTLKEGFHSVAMVPKMVVFVDPDNLEAGQYDSIEDLKQAIADAKLQDDEKRAQMLQNSLSNIQRLQLSEKKDERTSMLKDIFDGQSFATHMHQMDMYESLGRLGFGTVSGKRVAFVDLLLAKTYRALTTEEIHVLEGAGIVHNSKKTVTASRLQYHKLSEHILDRGDISILLTNTLPGQPGHEEEVAQKHKELHDLAWQIYNLRQDRNTAHASFMRSAIGSPDPSKVAGSLETKAQIQKLVQKMHDYFVPAPNRQILHSILNAMEYHQVDQLMDGHASKKVTSLPVELSDRSQPLVDGVPTGRAYINLNKATSYVDNRFKYLQVETSGVHEEVKMGVQAKVLLMADLNQLSERILDPKNSADFTDEEKEAAKDIPAIMARYQTSLTKLTQSKLDKLKKYLRDPKDNFNVADVFNMIRQSLLEQGADSNKLKWFELDASGKPKYGTNMPQIRKMLEYYFFSIYSNNVTDEKGQGFKNFHVSSFGYKLLYNRATGEIVPQSEIKKNPRKYANKNEYGSRYPGVAKEVDENGKVSYFMEVLMPRPAFESAGHEQFWRENVAKMFGTRIPTEDKRSMIALKVVDFIDESYRNSIIVPQAIHLLSGSDLDIDSLYGQKFNVYKDWLRHKDLLVNEGAQGQYRKYGSYDGLTGKPLQVRKFVEYFTHVTQVGDIADQVRVQKQLLMQQTTLGTLSSETYQMFELLGYDEDEIERIATQRPYSQEVLDMLREQTQDQELLSDEAFRSERRERFLERGFSEEEIGAITRDFDTTELREEYESERVKTARYEYKRALINNQLHRNVLRVEASIRALRAVTQLPATLAEFNETAGASDLITPVHQNNNLQAKLDVLTNPAVYSQLYINEQQSTKRFTRILKHLGVSASDIANLYGAYTIDGVLNVRGLNSMNKNGIAITANLNKFLSIASQYGLKLKPENTIWRVNNKSYNEFGGLDEDGVRAIALIGNMLGIFADGAKDPIPGALKMNEVNAHVTLSMIGLGIPAEAAMYLNFFPEIKAAVKNVQDAEKAISTEFVSERLQLHSEIGTVLNESFFRKPKADNSGYLEDVPEAMQALKELEMAGLLKEGRTKYFNFSVDAGRINVGFAVPSSKKMFDINNEKQMEQILPSEMGYVVSSAANGTIVLSPLAQKLVLLDLYRQQAQQGNSLKAVSRLINLYKRLNPNFVATDGIMKAIKELSTPELSLFTNSNQLFEEEQVFSVLSDMLKDLDEQSKLLFLERGRSAAPLVQLFSSLYQDKSQLSADLVRFVGMRMFQKFHNQGLTSPGALADTANMRAYSQVEMRLGISPNSGNITTDAEDLLILREKYPNMKLLSFYRIREVTPEGNYGAVIKTEDGRKLPKRGEVYLEQMNKGKTQGEFSEGLIDDHMTLLRDADPKIRRIARKLVFSEIFRGGLSDTPGSALRTLDQSIVREIGVQVEKFAQVLQLAEGKPELLLGNLQEVLGLTSQKEMLDVLDEMLVQMGNSALKNSQNARIPYARPVDMALTNKENEGAVAKAVPNTFSPTERKEQLVNAVAYFYGQDPALIKKLHSANSRKFSFLTKLKHGERLNISLEGGDVNQEVLELLGKNMGVRRVESEDDVSYQFPFIIRPKDSGLTYRLVAIDEMPVSGRLAAAMSTPLSIEEESLGKPVVQLLGKSASYEVLPAQLGSDNVSAMGLTVAEATRYGDVMRGKLTLVVNPDAVTNPAKKVVGKAAATLHEPTKATKPVAVTMKSGSVYSVYRDETGALHILDVNKEEVSSKAAAYQSILTAYKEVYLEDYRKGKTIDVTEIDNEHDYYEQIAERSENPQEVAQAWFATEPAELSETDRILKDGMRKTTEASFRRFGDANQVQSSSGGISLQFRRAYFSSVGQPLDTQAQELGLEVEDLVEFMTRNPGGQNTVRAEGGYHEKLAQRFYELTGFELDEDFANRLINPELAPGVTKAGVSDVIDQLLRRNLEAKLTVKNNTLEQGRFVKYIHKGVIKDFIIVDGNSTTNTWQIRDPRPEATTKVISGISGDKLVPTQYKGDLVYYSGLRFLVLPSNRVVPLDKTSHNRYNEEESGERKELLRIHQGVKNLDVADRAVAQHFFQDSAVIRTQGNTSSAFAYFQQEAKKLVQASKGQAINGVTLSNEAIVEKLSCIR